MTDIGQQVIAAAQEMLARGLTAGTVGNVSVRAGDGLLITPTRRHPDDLTSADLVYLEPGGPRNLRASIEAPLHTQIYAARPDIHAIVHTHSPHALARSFDPRPIVVETEERSYLGLDLVPVIPAAEPGTAQLAHSVAAALTDRPGVLIERHGVVGTGRTARDALELCTAIEHQCLVANHLDLRQLLADLRPPRRPFRSAPDVSLGCTTANLTPPEDTIAPVPPMARRILDASGP